MKTTIARYVNNGTQTVAANANILFTNNTFSNCALGYDNLGGIQIKKPGTYAIYASLLGVATGTNPVTVTMYENGTAVPGAASGATPAAIGNLMPLSLVGLTTVKQTYNRDTYATIAFKSNEATSFSNATVIIEKIE